MSGDYASPEVLESMRRARAQAQLLEGLARFIMDDMGGPHESEQDAALTACRYVERYLKAEAKKALETWGGL